MSSAQAKHVEVLRYFYFVVAVLALSAVLLLASVFAHFRLETRAQDRIARFHNRSLALIHEASENVADLELLQSREGAVAEPGAPGPAESITARRELSSTFFAIDQALDEVVVLQEEYGTERFAKTVARAERRLERVMLELSHPSASLTGRVDALAFSLFQLSRLHSIAEAETLRELAIDGDRRTRHLALAFALVLGISSLLVLRLLHLLRGRLVEHERMEEALLASERQLQQSSRLEALGTLVGGVAHDFNNLLTAILGHSEALLIGAAAGDPRQKGLEEIHKAGRRASALTRQLLVFSRQEPVEPCVVDLDATLREMEPLLRRLIPEDIELRLECGADVPPVVVDPNQAEQVILNLAVNARDAMPDGGTLSIRSSSSYVGPHPSTPPIPEGEYARITIEDDGCGMAPEVQQHAFEPFFTTKDRSQGTGLGLSTVHGIVSKSGGHVSITSEVGSGTRVDVYLPRSDGSPAERAEPVSVALARGVETILLVEDEEQVRRLAETALRGAGYEVLVARDGDAALRLCEEYDGPIHLVLTDVVMPGLRGPELVARAVELRPDLRAILVSGYTDDASPKEVGGRRAPLLLKPFELRRLLELVRGELDSPLRTSETGLGSLAGRDRL